MLLHLALHPCLSKLHFELAMFLVMLCVFDADHPQNNGGDN